MRQELLAAASCFPPSIRLANWPDWISLQDLLHLGARLFGDHARAARVVAVFRGVRNRVTHVAEAALVDQIDDQLHFVQALEIGHFGRVASVDQGLETGADQFADAAAEDSLLAEEVGFGLFLEGVSRIPARRQPMPAP